MSSKILITTILLGLFFTLSAYGDLQWVPSYKHSIWSSNDRVVVGSEEAILEEGMRVGQRGKMSFKGVCRAVDSYGILHIGRFLVEKYGEILWFASSSCRYATKKIHGGRTMYHFRYGSSKMFDVLTASSHDEYTWIGEGDLKDDTVPFNGLNSPHPELFLSDVPSNKVVNVCRVKYPFVAEDEERYSVYLGQQYGDEYRNWCYYLDSGSGGGNGVRRHREYKNGYEILVQLQY